MVVGGVLRAGEEINAKKIGSESYTKTEVEVGVSPKTKEELNLLVSERDELNAQLDAAEKNIRTLQKQKGRGGGKLPAEKDALLAKLLATDEQLKERITDLQEQIDELKAYLNVIETHGKVCASKQVYPGVKIIIKGAVFQVNQEYKFVTFTQENMNVRISTYEEPKIDSTKVLIDHKND